MDSRGAQGLPVLQEPNREVPTAKHPESIQRSAPFHDAAVSSFGAILGPSGQSFCSIGRKSHIRSPDEASHNGEDDMVSIWGTLLVLDAWL